MTAPEGAGWEGDDCTVVVVNWQTPAVTEATIGTVLRRWPRATVVLVDCSGDAPAELRRMEPAVRYLAPGNLGYAGGNSLGLRIGLEGGARWLLVLNSDAIPLDSALDRMREVLLQDPSVGVCGGALLMWRDGKPFAERGRQFDWPTGRAVPLGEEVGGTDYPGGAALMFTREALQAVGTFDVRLFLFFEEIDWVERATAAGYSFVIEPMAKFVHFGSMSVRRAPLATAFFLQRNRVLVLRRYAHRHGHPVSRRRDLQHIGRVLIGHFARFRWRPASACARGWVAGHLMPLAISQDPLQALAEQRWESRTPSEVFP